MLEYLLLRGINDQSADLVALASWAADLDVRINLIPFNSIESAPGIRGTPQSQRSAFAQGLKAKGFTVTLRHSLGADIAAACGQLVRNAPRVVSESGF
jgi:23S rRNA (adenine2503-C2)-methyltransferase